MKNQLLQQLQSTSVFFCYLRKQPLMCSAHSPAVFETDLVKLQGSLFQSKQEERNHVSTISQFHF